MDRLRRQFVSNIICFIQDDISIPSGNCNNWALIWKEIAKYTVSFMDDQNL